ncbi:MULTISPECIES: 3-phosphoserine/phosphohydroxythreonine transaminase [Cytobacillus]|jgi:phosphoserine aminotransferase|uniref:Phosphoserine aminotransferase n=1 Tax=Cytobacillus firmus TaxID=1399 RepID=A0AA46SL65_CYTFI|nr:MULTISPECIES: 3-phosphoserine/phosphohydroxythreonine transaminase [Cytobacillus]MBG9443216.1 MFS transporter [Cytobacillus firmus]MCC3645210.1 3-phosphoserine/phosphohydroxythreonine transaminase [Cytobacillus oceanisediminis]MCS0651772.1 3-phosphoserine/phosphohydroxythreonine transaminase [Cytobacillus firmus]MCU1805021.1 3-phosphoserine/phosphohydroxythreonine transaminase [Cytobacillus firmus]UYG96909.1 3-phosphoserine/phosphohydroxythreonine transaminase [Cytobacillus firmus]
MYRALNFNAGPAALPEEVLKEAEKSLLNFGNTGMGIMELSHRSNEYQAVHDQAITRLRRLLAIPDDFEVLFIQGGASLQFSMVPMNLLGKDQAAHYILSGSWSEKALKEADKIGETVISASSKEQKYSFIPEFSQDDMPDNAAYLHITSNNTIYGTQWQSFPSNKKTPVVADMSSDILSRPLKVDQFDLIYAGAQKNLGPSGVTVVIIRKELLKRSSETLPIMLNYNTFANNNSLYNTPPTLSIYLLSLVLQWAEQIGGLQQIEKANEKKAKMLYDVIDESEGFYIGHAHKNSRSRMNVTFNLHSEDLSREFQIQAKEAGFVGLGGHRSIGGCRASIYNAVPEHHVEKLAAFMKAFKNNN